MQTFRIQIDRVSDGTSEEDTFRPGSGIWVTTPDGPTRFVTQATDAQITGIQGYIMAIKSGASTSAIETAVAAVAT